MKLAAAAFLIFATALVFVVENLDWLITPKPKELPVTKTRVYK